MSASLTAATLEEARYRGRGVGWDEIVGLDHARREVAAVLALLKRREVARRVGAELTPLLFTGPAGVGKTLMAKAISRDLELPLYQWVTSELDAPLIASIFDALRSEACVIFFDELDLIGTDRQSRQHSDRTKSALVQLCAELDGMDVVDGPLIVGATAAHVFMLDDSLLRSGRFSTKIEFSLPSHAERVRLFELYAARLTLAEPLDLDEAAARSQGASGADVRAILNAGLALALADGAPGLTGAHLFEALERRGYVRRSVEIPAEQLWSLAVHEAGHTLVAFALLGGEALNRVTIIPSNLTSGYSDGHFSLSEEWRERHPFDSTTWQSECLIGFGGAVAEELLLGRHVLGSGTDVAQVTSRLLWNADQGANAELGPLAPASVEGDHAYGSAVMRDRLWASVERQSRELYAEARRMLEPQRFALESFARALCDHGSLSGDALIETLRSAGCDEASVAPL